MARNRLEIREVFKGTTIKVPVEDVGNHVKGFIVDGKLIKHGTTVVRQREQGKSEFLIFYIN